MHGQYMKCFVVNGTVQQRNQEVESSFHTAIVCSTVAALSSSCYRARPLWLLRQPCKPLSVLKSHLPQCDDGLDSVYAVYLESSVNFVSCLCPAACMRILHQAEGAALARMAVAHEEVRADSSSGVPEHSGKGARKAATSWNRSRSDMPFSPGLVVHALAHPLWVPLILAGCSKALF